MIGKSKLKEYAALKDKKARTESSLFIAEGRKMVQEGLRSACPCEVVFVREGFFGKDEETDQALSTARVEVLPEAEFRKLSGTENSQGVLGVFDFRPLLTDKLESERAVALFEVADPRNVGTIIRSADWFGFGDLLVGESCADPFNEKVVRSTMGSIFHVRLLLSRDFAADLEALKADYRIVTADLGGVDYRRRSDHAGKTAFVFSNEARGPSEAVLALTDEVVTIPGAGRAESLNVACAAAVIMAGAAPFC